MTNKNTAYPTKSDKDSLFAPTPGANRKFHFSPFMLIESFSGIQETHFT